MQLYFLVFSSFSILYLPNVVKKNLFDYFSNPSRPFSKFALSVFQDSTSYFVFFVFWMISMETVNAPAGW